MVFPMTWTNASAEKAAWRRGYWDCVPDAIFVAGLAPQAASTGFEKGRLWICSIIAQLLVTSTARYC